MRPMLAATIAGAVLAVLAISGGPAMAQEPQASWVARETSRCDPQTGHVIVAATVTNTGDLALTVTVTEVTFQGQSDTAVVPPGASHTFFLDAGPAPLPGGQVAYHVEWDGGSRDFTRDHSPTSACTTTTSSTTTVATTTTQPVTTTTTEPVTSTTTQPVGPTTTQPVAATTTQPVAATTTQPVAATTTQPVAATTTQPVAATTTQPVAATTTTPTPTVSPTSITSTTKRTTTATPVVAPTTVRPGGTAFTGVENVVPLGAIALMLMTGGSGLLWVSRRRRQDTEDEE